MDSNDNHLWLACKLSIEPMKPQNRIVLRFPQNQTSSSSLAACFEFRVRTRINKRRLEIISANQNTIESIRGGKFH